MRNWSTNVFKFRKGSEQYIIWKLQQMINFGLDEGEKINESQLRKHFKHLQIDPDRKNLLKLLLNAQ